MFNLTAGFAWPARAETDVHRNAAAQQVRDVTVEIALLHDALGNLMESLQRAAQTLEKTRVELDAFPRSSN